MLMQFEVLKQSIIDNIFTPAESGRYITIGHQRQRESAEVINGNRQITVYFSESEIPKSAGQAYGDVMHDIAFMIELAVVSSAEVDLSILNDENATENAKATALRMMSEAGVIADASMDELIRIAFQILMDARNVAMGLPQGSVSNRWVDQIRKGSPVPDGEYLTLTASMRLTCRVAETITGEDLLDTPENGAVFDGDIELSGDDTAEQGVEVTTL